MANVTSDTTVSVSIRIPIAWVAQLATQSSDGDTHTQRASATVKNLVAKHIGKPVPAQRSRGAQLTSDQRKQRSKTRRETKRAAVKLAFETLAKQS